MQIIIIIVGEIVGDYGGKRLKHLEIMDNQDFRWLNYVEKRVNY